MELPQSKAHETDVPKETFKLPRIVRITAKICALISSLLTTPSCAPIFIPEGNRLRTIENMRYDSEYMNCLHKATLYDAHLKSMGFKSRVAVGELLGRLYVDSDDNFHAWVEVFNPKTGIWHMIDPTKGGGDGFGVEHYPNRNVFCHYENIDFPVDLTDKALLTKLRALVETIEQSPHIPGRGQ